MKRVKTLLSLLVAVLLVFGMLPLASFADNYEEYYGDNYYLRYNGYYYGYPYYYSTNSDYYTYYDGYRYYNDNYYNGYYGDYNNNYNSSYHTNTNDIPTYDVEPVEMQVYDGSEKIAFTVFDGTKHGLLSVVLYPTKNRNKEVILERGVDYKVKSSEQGLVITLQDSILDELNNGKYEVKMFFTRAEATVTFKVDY